MVGDKNKSYRGAGGELYVMSQLLALGWNVAIPLVDVGDDVLVVEDKNKALRRVQVKTSLILKWDKKGDLKDKKGFLTQFEVPIKQLSTPFANELFYAFVVRKENDWLTCFVLRREKLEQIRDNYENGGNGRKPKAGSKNHNLMIYFDLEENTIEGWGVNFKDYQEKFASNFEPIDHDS